MKGNVLLLFLVLFPMAGALISFAMGRFSRKARCLFADAVTILEFITIACLFIRKACGGSDLSFRWEGFCGMGMGLELDGFRVLYGGIAALMWMMTTIFSEEYFAHYRNRNRYYMFMLMTLGATMGVFLSADLFTTFIFFEIMSFTSYPWVAHEEKEAAMRAAETYLAVAVIGGMVMLMGIFLLYDMTGTLQLSGLLEASRQAASETPARLYLAGGLMIFGFGAKAGMFPLHIWLPKAHPVAPAPASALLSGILTKSGIFGVLAVTCNIFLHDPQWGMVILLLGTVTMFGGALLAVFSVNFKRTLACSSMSQIGFILVGVGMQCLLGEENALAVRGTLLHMVNHSLFKLDLFMVAGVIYMNLHKLNLNDLRGFGRKKPLLMFCYLMGALGISGVPLWNGYVSKTLLHESIVEYKELLEEGQALVGSVASLTAIEWIFLISGGMTAAYMLKLFFAVFLEENTDKELQARYDACGAYWNGKSKFAIVTTAVLLPILGFFPKLTMDRLADLGQGFMHGVSPAEAVHYLSLTNLKGSAISLAIGVILYFGVIRTLLMAKNEDGVRVYVDRWPRWLDLENLLYRPILQVILPTVCGTICAFFDAYIIDVPLKVSIAVASVISRAGDHLVDSLIVLARKTTHRQHATMMTFEQHDHLATGAGALMDRITHSPDEKSHIPALVEIEEETKRTGRIVAGTISFGLMMMSAGLIVVLIYLMIEL